MTKKRICLDINISPAERGALSNEAKEELIVEVFDDLLDKLRSELGMTNQAIARVIKDEVRGA